MKKKVIVTSFAFFIGLAFAFLLDSHLRKAIQEIFLWSTNNKIIFVGKDFFLSLDFYYYIAFGLLFAVLALDSFKKKTSDILKNAIVSIIIFIVLVFLFSSVNANLELVECTACDDGIRKINWRDINYSMILAASAMIAGIPSMLSILKRTLKNS